MSVADSWWFAVEYQSYSGIKYQVDISVVEMFTVPELHTQSSNYSVTFSVHCVIDFSKSTKRLLK